MAAMPSNPTEMTAAGKPAGGVRRRPLVSPDLVRRWAAQAGVVVRDGPLDEATVELYLYWRGRRRRTGREIDGWRAPTAARAPGAAPPVSPALLEAASCASTAQPCPTCGAPGYLTYVDLSRAIQRQRCHPCGQQWTSVIAPIAPDADGRAGRTRHRSSHARGLRGRLRDRMQHPRFQE